VLRGNLVSALMQVCGRWLWIERIQPEVVKLLREYCNRQSGGLSAANLQIELAERIKALECCVTLQRRQTFDRRTDEAVFQRLGKREPVFYQRPGDRGAWCEPSNANNVPIAVPRARNKILNGEVKFVEVARAGFHAGDCTGELSIFGVVRVGNHLNGLEHIYRQADGLSASCRIGDI